MSIGIHALSSEAITKAEKIIGSEKELARKIGVCKQKLNSWKLRSLIPYHMAVAIFITTKYRVDIDELRPDLKSFTKRFRKSIVDNFCIEHDTQRLAINIDAINVTCCRQDFGDMENLKTSILKIGLVHPIKVNFAMELVDGERRLRAFRDLSKNSIPVALCECKHPIIGRIIEDLYRKPHSAEETRFIAEKVSSIDKHLESLYRNLYASEENIMAQITVATKEVLQSYQLLQAEQESHLPLRVAFLGLLNCCDKNGVFCWQPRHLKLKILPYEEVDFATVLEVLVERDFIGKHEEKGKSYGYVLPQTLLSNWV